MARDTDPDSRPISVAELLARRAAETDGTASETPADESRPAGRRRRGGEGTVSVAELTGEIPRIRGGAHSGSFPAVTPEQAAAPTPTPAPTTGRRRAPDAQAPSPTVDDELTEIAPSTDDLAAESSFVPDDPHVADAGDAPAFPRSDRPAAPGHDDRFPRSDPPRPSWGGAQAWSSPTPSRPDQPPATRDLNSADVHARFARPEPEQADEVTGIIPRFGAGQAAGPAADDDFARLSPEERDRAFESYRNFDDVDVEEAAPRKRRGLFGALRRSRADDDTPPPADETTDDTAPESSIAHTDLLSGSVDDGRLEVSDDTPTELTDVSRSSWSAQAWSDRPDVDDAPREEPAQDDDLPSTTRFAADSGDDATGVVDLDKAQRHDSVRPAWRGADPEPETEPAPQTGDDATGPSPARQWAMLGLQVVAGLAVGVGLFLGFTELWRWNVYFALVLAVVVIFGLVTFVHVARRSSDLVSTLIALAVGLVVTIGPLALLASGS
ncbi:hypothetical protein [uncultured Williamsia sp.]|uniref:hypothetical protein n=1 Tax=uncultured Williamsia sp. TaxID=259311 RepID=UPI0026195537|nr:hypothetical protein [uncultured Williamsia sp.]